MLHEYRSRAQSFYGEFLQAVPKQRLVTQELGTTLDERIIPPLRHYCSIQRIRIDSNIRNPWYPALLEP
jgi:hypothetical protein